MFTTVSSPRLLRLFFRLTDGTGRDVNETSTEEERMAGLEESRKERERKDDRLTDEDARDGVQLIESERLDSSVVSLLSLTAQRARCVQP